MKIAVIIPSYRVTKHIQKVIDETPSCVKKIYVVDDNCPDHSGKFVEKNISDPRVKVLYHDKNQGVGGATLTGMLQALKKIISTSLLKSTVMDKFLLF